MPPNDWAFRITDILDAIDKIQRYTQGMNFDDFAQDDRTVDAVIRNLSVIGEAARHVPEEIQARFPDIAWVEMRGMRNVIIHQYADVSLPIIWQTIQQDLPPLTPHLLAMLDQDL